jgi:hypothetical protein
MASVRMMRPTESTTSGNRSASIHASIAAPSQKTATQVALSVLLAALSAASSYSSLPISFATILLFSIPRSRQGVCRRRVTALNPSRSTRTQNTSTKHSKGRCRKRERRLVRIGGG